MVLHERDHIIQILNNSLRQSNETGQIVLLSGHPGMGKTSVVKKFLNALPISLPSYVGYCDALFTPRPLGPLQDILVSEHKDTYVLKENQRDSMFMSLFNMVKERSVLVFEDVHWADNGTLDFIKFLSRRLQFTKCLLILTFRPDEIKETSILGISHNTGHRIHRVQLQPLSKDIVLALSQEKGIDGSHVFALTNGNPFYTFEYLNNPSDGIPESINNLIVSRLAVLETKEQEALSVIALFPNPVALPIVTKLVEHWDSVLINPTEYGFISIEGNLLRFRHEIVRLVIASSVSAIKKIVLHSGILEILKEEDTADISELIHHARGAKKFSLVAELAPTAARRASQLGVHKEAAFLFKAAIECTEQLPNKEWGRLLEEYSFECYLTNNLQEAINFRYKALEHIERTSKNDISGIGINYCWLSRLYWYQADSANAFKFGELAVKSLGECPNQNYAAQTFSNYGQLYMLKGDFVQAIHWNTKAYDIAKSLNNLDIQSHSLTNLGSIRIRTKKTVEEGYANLELAEKLAIEAQNHDHLARIYTTLLCDKVIKRKDPSQIMEKTLDFCMKHQVESYYHYNLAWRSYYLFQKGEWQESLTISEQLLGVSNQARVNTLVAVISKSRILMRQGNADVKELLIQIAKIAEKTEEALRMVPIAIAMLEFEWLFDFTFEDRNIIFSAIEQLSKGYGVETYSGELAFWCSSHGMIHTLKTDPSDGFNFLIEKDKERSIAYWTSNDFPYELALSYCLGDDDDIREGLHILDKLQAVQTKKRIREYLKNSGRQSVPKGIRRSTRSNPLHLTNREMDVLSQVSKGLSNSEIASTLFISSKTVDNHVSSILMKMEVNARQKAVIKAMEMKII
ncbi:MAG: LuxR C-terminal-related transcriptional regulator [Bacteroidota bacterium]